MIHCRKRENKNHTHTHTDAHTSLAPPAVKSTHNPQSLMDKLRKVGRITLFLQVSVFKTNTKSVCTVHCDRGHNTTAAHRTVAPGRQGRAPVNQSTAAAAFILLLSQRNVQLVVLHCFGSSHGAVGTGCSHPEVFRSSHRSAV